MMETTRLGVSGQYSYKFVHTSTGHKLAYSYYIVGYCWVLLDSGGDVVADMIANKSHRL